MKSTNASEPGTRLGWQSENIGRNNLDFFRFWLAILVIFSHSYALTEGDEHNEPLGILTHGQLNSGPFAVCCFFIISGFLITHSWMRSQSPLSYLKKRICRIYPGFIVATLVGIFVIAPAVSDTFEFGKRQILLLPLNLMVMRPVALPGVFPNNPYPGSLNGSLWTIPYEFKCYLVVMLVGSIGLLKNRKHWFLGLFIATVLAGAAYPYFDIPELNKGGFAAIVGSALVWSWFLPCFGAGMVFYIFRDRIPYSSLIFVFSAIAFIIAAMLPPLGRLVFPFAISYALFWLAFHPSIRLDGWSRYGDFSYGIYLFAFPIQQLVQFWMPGCSPFTNFLIATPLSVIAGALSWHLVEKHFLKQKFRRTLSVPLASP